MQLFISESSDMKYKKMEKYRNKGIAVMSFDLFKCLYINLY